MAPKSSVLFLLLALFIYSTSCTLFPQPPVEQNITLYFCNILTGPNPNFVRVAGRPGERWSLTDFGTVFVYDTLVTVGPSPNSTTVGRAQGIFVVASLDGSNAYVSFSLEFSDTPRAGSTLEIQGTFKQNANVSEVAVVSGTVKYRFAKGYLVATPIVSNSCDLLIRAEIIVRYG